VYKTSNAIARESELSDKEEQTDGRQKKKKEREKRLGKMLSCRSKNRIRILRGHESMKLLTSHADNNRGASRPVFGRTHGLSGDRKRVKLNLKRRRAFKVMKRNHSIKEWGG